jgi:anti-sigma factor RsiW
MRLKCSENDIALYVEGELAPAPARAIQAHLVSCNACRNLAASLEDSQAMLKSLRQDTVSPAALSSVRTRVLAEIHAAAAWRPWRRWVYAVAGATFAVVIGFGVIDRAPKTAVVQEIVEQVPATPAVPVPSENTPPLLQTKNRAVIDRAYSADNAGSAVGAVYDRAPSGGTLPDEDRVTSSPPPPLVVKLLTDDPNIVIYWLVEKTDGGGTL